jgi:hypothetical protein
MRSLAALLLALIVSACSRDEPQVRVGRLAVAEASFASLQPLEREILLDLLAFAAAVADGNLEEMTRPGAERTEAEGRLSRLSLHLGAARLGLDEGRMRAAYETNPEWELVVRHVVRLASPTAPTELRRQAHELATEVAARAAAGEDFAGLAARFSEEPGAARRGGLLQPGRRGGWVDPFWAAAAGLAPGAVSGVVETEYGFHVLKLEERRPVPYQEVDRGRLLQGLVPPEVSAEAMGEWVGRNGAILLDPPATAAGRRHILTGAPIPEALVLASGILGGEYGGRDLETGWALLSPEARLTLERADELSFGAWVHDDARSVIWAAAARELGVEPPAGAVENARLRWQARISHWAAVFGFSEEMPAGPLVDAAMGALLSGQPDARAARQELRSFRPLLRRLYPAVRPAS